MENEEHFVGKSEKWELSASNNSSLCLSKIDYHSMNFGRNGHIYAETCCSVGCDST